MVLCRELRRELLQPGTVLIYGEAGVGKTTFALEVLRESCTSSCLYVTTERLDFLRRAVSISIDLRRLIVYEAIGPEDFLDIITFRRLIIHDAVVVDSINNYAYESEAAYKLTALLASSLHEAAEKYGLIVVETAQVRWSPEEGAKPASLHAVELWADKLIEIRRGKDGRRVAIIDGREYVFSIGPGGIVWHTC